MNGDAGLCERSASELVRAVQAREVSRREVVAAHLERIERLDGAVNAISQLRAEQALAEADAADRRGDDGAARPLDGVPVTIKEHYDVAGMVSSEGSADLAERRAEADNVAVARLRRAGAIVVGKANQPDFAMRWNTISGLYGTTRNPRDLRLSAGGSSGGDAAAVAAGMAPIGLGGDLGGSIRVPASFCGIVGLRPTPGRVPMVATIPPFDGTLVRDAMSSVGPLARTVDDLWLALSVMAGAHPGDPASAMPELAGPPRRAPLTVARMCGENGAVVDPAVEAELDRAAAALRDAGYRVVDAAFPSARQAPDLWGQIVGTELLRYAIPAFRDQMEETCRQHIETMLELWQPGEDVRSYIGAWVERRRIVRETALWMEEHPLILSPVAGMPTPPLEFDHMLSSAQTADLVDRMRHAMWVPLLGLPGVALPTGLQIVARRHREDEALAAAGAVLDALGPIKVATPPV
jgi:amidase